MARSHLSLEAQIGKFLWHLLILLTDRILSHSPNFGRPKQGPKKILNFFSEYWVRKDFLGVCLKKFSQWNFSGTERFTKNKVNTNLRAMEVDASFNWSVSNWNCTAGIYLIPSYMSRSSYDLCAFEK